MITDEQILAQAVACGGFATYDDGETYYSRYLEDTDLKDELLAFARGCLPAWVSVDDRLPPPETPVLIVYRKQVRIGELRWDHPGFEDTYKSYQYWDDTGDDGQAWEWADITHWAPLLELPCA